MQIKKHKKLIIIVSVVIILIFLISGLKNHTDSTYSKSLDQYRKLSIKDDSTIPKNLPDNIVWMANHETGDLRQWRYGSTGTPEQDSGFCKRPGSGVTDEVAHSGKYSMKLSINSWYPHSGCRQFRYPEIKTGKDYYYSAWLYFPKDYKITNWSNIMQFKARKEGDGSANGSKVFWVLRLMNKKSDGSMYFQLHWDNENGVSGPYKNDPLGTDKYFSDNSQSVPAKQWVHVEIFLKQSSEFDGQLIVWQDGKEIYNVKDVRTKMPGGFNSWSVNSYGGGIYPNPFTVYVDDAVVSTTQIGPDFKP